MREARTMDFYRTAEYDWFGWTQSDSGGPVQSNILHWTMIKTGTLTTQ